MNSNLRCVNKERWYIVYFEIAIVQTLKFKAMPKNGIIIYTVSCCIECRLDQKP